MIKVAIIQRDIPHYRVRFFEEVSVQASANGLAVTVYSGIAGNPSFTFSHRNLPVSQMTNRKAGPFWMEGLTAALKGSDVIVAPQELQCLNVPYLWIRRRNICRKWIWWGHGYNFQASIRPSISTSIKERIKHFMTRRADGIITYTGRGADYWRQRGFPADRVIAYNNTIDVEGLRRAGKEVTDEQREELRRTLSLHGKQVLLFSGRLYLEKQVDFLLRAFALLKKSYPDVALLIIGDGEERSALELLAIELELRDVHFLGELVDPKVTAAVFMVADLMVIPALVGLAVVHGYAFGLPLITTSFPGHGPEIEYVVGDVGVRTYPTERDMVTAITNALGSEPRLSAMRKAAMAHADRLDLPTSAQRFVNALLSV